jgi:organic radical activating enzyme
MDGPHLAANSAAAVDYCRRHPQWRISVQLHKLLGVK